MAFYFASAERMDGKVVLYLTPDQTVQPPVPFELQTFIMPDEWESRIRAIRRTASRYSKPMLERLWVITGLLATFLLPMTLYTLVFNALHVNRKNDNDKQDAFFKARLIGMSIFIGISLLFWVPIGAWKYVGRKRMQNLLKQWTEADVLARASGAFVPIWNVRTPGIFDSRTQLTITTPPSMAPTNFHPGAYLPPYIAPAMGFQAPYGLDEKAPFPLVPAPVQQGPVPI